MTKLSWTFFSPSRNQGRNHLSLRFLNLMAESPEDDFILSKSKLRILEFSAHMHTDTQTQIPCHGD